MHLVKKFLLGLIVLISIALAGIWYGGWGAVAPTQQTLAKAKLAPIIPIGDFFANTSSKWAYAPSPASKYMTWRVVEGINTYYKYQPFKGGKTTSINLKNVRSVFWSNDDKALYLFKLEIKKRRYVLWKANPNNLDQKWQDVTPRGFKNWHIFYRPKDGLGRWLVSSRDRDPSFTDIYSIQPNGSEKRLLLKNNGNISDWFIDDDGKIWGRRVSLKDKTYAIEILKSDSAFSKTAKWHQLFTYSERETFRLLGYSKSKGIVAASRRNRDKQALVNINLETGKETILNQHPDVDLQRTFNLASYNSVDIVNFAPGYNQYLSVTNLGKKVLALLDNKSGPFQLNMLGFSKDRRYLTFSISYQESGWQYVLIDTKNNTKKILGQSPFAKYNSILSKTKPVTFTARDGTKIPAFLTTPHGIETKNLPTVIAVHGGPASHFIWAFDYERQFLANRGYAVLLINFRGSTGYGKRFQQAGFRQFGRKMQDDIVDGTKWAIKQGIADPKRIAIYGASYGGYAAMMGLARDPEIYAAGISIVGATDMEYQTRYAPHSWRLGLDAWTRYFGSADNEDDLKDLRKYSPVNMVKSIKAPVFLAHGINDRIVDRAQSEAFEKQLKKHGKTYEAIYFEKEGHGLRRWQSKIIFYTKLEQFLAKHLGGRTGGFHYTQIGAKWIK